MALEERRKIVAGNWKMHKSIGEALSFVKDLIDSLSGLPRPSAVEVFLSVPFTALHAVACYTATSSLVIGAQNMHDATEGAYTGEISAAQLIDAGASFVLLGHSERRAQFFEDPAFIGRKLRRALSKGLQPILCIGESLEEREAGRIEQVLASQLIAALEGVDAVSASKIILAYEPVWAIGTGRSATPKQAEEAHAFCRSTLVGLLGVAAQVIPILYGGSVRFDNALQFLSQPNIDGVLVGGAALEVETFFQIISSYWEYELL